MTAGAIPIENIYYLLCYAWDILPESDFVATRLLPEMQTHELLGRLLQRGVAGILRRGIDRAYLQQEEELAGVRGRIDMGASIKKASFLRARAQCRFDELSSDVLHNRILKETLRRLANVRDMDPLIAEELLELYRRFPEVTDTQVTLADFRRVILTRNNSAYRFPLRLCEIAHRNLLVDERPGEVLFRDFVRDDRQMAKVFERFLYRFYRRELPGFRVHAPRFPWRARGEAADLAHLPLMRTDIVLRRGGKTIVIDAKYYSSMLTTYMSKSSVRSAHMYQLFSYMKHLGTEGEAANVRGILLYPRTTQSRRIKAEIYGHPLQICTINLAQPWQGIRGDLLSVARDSASEMATPASVAAG